jgi:hypothetical protein
MRTFGAIGLIALTVFLQGCASGPFKNPHGPAFNGIIQSVNLDARRLTVAPLKPDEPVIFGWDERSKFWANGLRIDPTFLEARDLVRIHYLTNSGPWTVQHLYLETHRTVH